MKCKPKRVLMLLENEGYPEITRASLEGQSLLAAGYQVSVICPTGDSRQLYENVEGVHVYRYPKPWEPGGLLGYVWEYGYSLAMTFIISVYVSLRRGFDVVHIHTPPEIYVILAYFYKLFGKWYVMDLRDLSPELYQSQNNGEGNGCIYAVLCWFERLACQLADRLIATNDTQRNVQIERGGAAPELCHVVRNPPGAGFLLPAEPLDSLRREGRTVIGYMGMMGIQDRVDVFLHAIHFLKSEFQKDNFQAVLVGMGSALNDLKALCTELGLDPIVQFAGYRIGEDLFRHVSSFDICVTPDPSDPYNDSCTMLKMMEYMAMGKPVVAFDLPENRVSAGDAVLFAEGHTAQDLARQIVYLMDHPDEAALLGHRGRQRVIESLRWERQERGFVRVFDSLFTGEKRCCSTAPPPRSLTRRAEKRASVSETVGEEIRGTA